MAKARMVKIGSASYNVRPRKGSSSVSANDKTAIKVAGLKPGADCTIFFPRGAGGPVQRCAKNRGKKKRHWGLYHLKPGSKYKADVVLPDGTRAKWFYTTAGGDYERRGGLSKGAKKRKNSCLRCTGKGKSKRCRFVSKTASGGCPTGARKV